MEIGRLEQLQAREKIVAEIELDQEYELVLTPEPDAPEPEAQSPIRRTGDSRKGCEAHRTASPCLRSVPC